MSTCQTTKFVHLHVRSGYSFYQSTIQIESQIERTKELNMPAVAITDVGSMAGAMECYFKSKKQGIKGIVGATVVTVPDRKTPELAESSLVLLCENMTGYRNLCHLLSATKPANMDFLARHSSGLIALSGGMYGEINMLCSLGRMDEAIQEAQRYGQLFPDRFYIELHPARTPEEHELNSRLKRIAAELSLPVVVTAPCHYLLPEDKPVLDILGKIGKRPINSQTGASGFWYMSPEEIIASFPDERTAVENSHKIADLCQLEINSSSIYLPEYPMPPDRSYDEELRNRSIKGLTERLAGSGSAETAQAYHDRLEHELVSIKHANFALWFLFIADVVALARQTHIPVGPGRGRYSSSLVSYCLGISDVDPIRYDLIFERFINPDRLWLPDFFIDVAKSKKKKLIKLVADRFGRDRVVLTTSFHCLKGRNLMRQTGRLLNIDEEKVARFVRLCTEYSFFKDGFISSCVKDEKIRAAIKENSELDQLFQVARKLDGLPYGCSTLFREIAITPSPASDFFPIKKKGCLGIIPYKFWDVQRAGIPTFTMAGLKDLDDIDQFARSMQIDIDGIPENDEATFKLIASGDTRGVFQLHSSGMQKLLQRIKPTKLADLAATTALYRPGPIESGMTELFIRRKHGLEAKSDFERCLADNLGETYGVIVYLEQIMEIAHRLAGYSYQKADIFVRTLQKVVPEQVETAERAAFINAAKANGADRQMAESVYNLMKSRAEHTFSKSHSIAQAMISYRAAYLKAHFTEKNQQG